MSMFISQLINGINVSAGLLLAALGMAIIFGIMNVVNMAHGELIMIGAYVASYTTITLKLPFVAAMAFSFVITAALGALIELTVIKRLYGKPVETMIATFALSLILQQLIIYLFGTAAQRMDLPLSGAIRFGDISIPYYNICTGLMAALGLALTAVIFFKTVAGKKIRAITQNRAMCECLGINTAHIDTFTFSYGAGLAGLAGCILAPIKNISPDMGASYLTDSFMTVVVGGVNSLLGTTVGSVLIGESVTTMGGYISEITAKIIVFLLIIIFIRFRPLGLFSKERR